MSIEVPLVVGFSRSSTQIEWHDCRVSFLRQVLSNIVDACLIVSLVHLRHVFYEALNFGQHVDGVVLLMVMARFPPPTESGTKLSKYIKTSCSSSSLHSLRQHFCQFLLVFCPPRKKPFFDTTKWSSSCRFCNATIVWKWLEGHMQVLVGRGGSEARWMEELQGFLRLIPAFSH